MEGAWGFGAAKHRSMGWERGAPQGPEVHPAPRALTAHRFPRAQLRSQPHCLPAMSSWACVWPDSAFLHLFFNLSLFAAFYIFFSNFSISEK